MQGNPIDDSGKSIGNLSIISPIGKVGRSFPYNCRCFCGEDFIAQPESIRQGLVKSCGCLRAAHARRIGALPSTIKKGKEAHQRYFDARRIKAGLQNINAYGIHKALRSVTVPPILDKFLKEAYGTCCLCGSDSRLVVHHIRPAFECIKNRQLHLLYDAANLSVVCRKCHSDVIHSDRHNINVEIQNVLFIEAAKRSESLLASEVYLVITNTIRKNLRIMNFESVIYL